MKRLITLFSLLLFMSSLSINAQEMIVDIEKSSLNWIGKKVTGSHDGNIMLSKGSLSMNNEKITEGSFTIDMNSITNSDIEDEEYRNKLIGHLKSDDFFSVQKFPEATLKIDRSSAFKNNEAKVKAHLTIKGITHPLEFIARKDGNNLSAEIIVDRSKYDIRYGSGSFFDNLGDNMIYDDFTMTVKLITLPQNSVSK